MKKHTLLVCLLSLRLVWLKNIVSEKRYDFHYSWGTQKKEATMNRSLKAGKGPKSTKLWPVSVKALNSSRRLVLSLAKQVEKTRREGKASLLAR